MKKIIMSDGLQTIIFGICLAIFAFVGCYFINVWFDSILAKNPKINTGSFYTVGENTVYQCYKYKSEINNSSVNDYCGDRICLNGVEYLVGNNYTLMYDKDKNPLQCVYTANKLTKQ